MAVMISRMTSNGMNGGTRLTARPAARQGCRPPQRL